MLTEPPRVVVALCLGTERDIRKLEDPAVPDLAFYCCRMS